MRSLASIQSAGHQTHKGRHGDRQMAAGNSASTPNSSLLYIFSDYWTATSSPDHRVRAFACSLDPLHHRRLGKFVSPQVIPGSPILYADDLECPGRSGRPRPDIQKRRLSFRSALLPGESQAAWDGGFPWAGYWLLSKLMTRYRWAGSLWWTEAFIHSDVHSNFRTLTLCRHVVWRRTKWQTIQYKHIQAEMQWHTKV